LPWLCPGADALLALARTDGAAAWAAVSHDPGALLLLVRHEEEVRSLSTPFSPSLLENPHLLEAALQGLVQHGERGFIDWSRKAVQAVYRAALGHAQRARRLAEITGRGDPYRAWIGGLLAPLGWLGLCAADPSGVEQCLAQPDYARRPAAIERRQWGADQGALARRLARRWGLPEWLAAIVGHLGLPPEVATHLGADTDLFTIVHAAVVIGSQHPGGPRLEVFGPAEKSAAALGLSPATVEALRLGVESGASQELGEQGPAAAGAVLPPFRRPGTVPLLPDLLALAGENRCLRATLPLRRLEREVDALHEALREQRAAEAARLLAQKLDSLAEFAAGAGHEINNPLAVISGQAQFLLNKLRAPRTRDRLEGLALGENGTSPSGNGGLVHVPAATVPTLTGPEAENSLRKIIEQAQRVHHILRDLMQFARPARPQKLLLDMADIVREVVASLDDLAAGRQVRVLFPQPVQAFPVQADPSQLRTALTCLLRNGIEAAPAGGWAAIRLEAPEPGWIDVVVEDNGPGPPPGQREHLFDPFYSGRPAGRGRGLGLPTAWRLTREHGGNVRHVSLAEGPTRFILTMPLSVEERWPAASGD
jgi:signal transduction histidine kinase